MANSNGTLLASRFGGLALQFIATLIVLGIAWGVLDTNVQANKHAVATTQEQVTDNEKRLDAVEQTVVRAVTILERVEDKLDDIDGDLEQHMRQHGHSPDGGHN